MPLLPVQYPTGAGIYCKKNFSRRRCGFYRRPKKFQIQDFSAYAGLFDFVDVITVKICETEPAVTSRYPVYCPAVNEGSEKIYFTATVNACACKGIPSLRTGADLQKIR